MQTEEPVDKPDVGTPEDVPQTQKEGPAEELISLPAEEAPLLQTSVNEPAVEASEDKLSQTEETTDKLSVVKLEDASTQTAKSEDESTVVPAKDTSPQSEEPVDEPVIGTPAVVEPKTQTWRAIVHPWQEALLAVLPIFLLTRFIFVLLAYVGGVLFTAADFAATSVSYHDLLANWNRGDVTNYITIATNGYTQPQQTLLFPLFPTLIRALAPLFRHSQLIASFFLSNLAFLGVLVVLYLLVESEFDRDTAKRATIYIAIFPTAYVFFIGYSESLFLFFVLLSFYSMRRGSWWLAGLFGTLATLTQFAGVFLFVAFLYEAVRQMRPTMRQSQQESILLQQARPVVPAIAALCIPLALAFYFTALGTLLGDPFVFIKTQAQTSAGFSSIPLALKTLVAQPHFSIGVAQTLLEGGAFLLFAILLVLCFYGPKRFKNSQWSFALFGVFLLFLALWFSGNVTQDSSLYEPLALMPRLVLSIFPGFVILARFGRYARVHTAYLLLALPMLAFFVLQFITGRWLF